MTQAGHGEGEADSAGGPLAGIAIAEIGGEVAVRYCGRLFAQMGASVWRVGDETAPRVDPLFGAWLDQGKQRAESAEAALAAVEAAGGPALAIAGQTAAKIAEAEADLARRATPPPMLALTWFDPRGAYGDWRANDAIIQALNGVAFGFGPPEGPPTLPKGFAPQIVAGVTAFIPALAALMGERKPRRIEANVYEAALCFTETGAIGAAAHGWESRRLGVNRFSPTWPCSLYRASDGWVGVTALTPAQWVALARLLGRGDLAEEPRFVTSLQRLAAAEEIDAIVAEAIATRPSAYWVENGDRLRIPIAPAPPPGQLPDLPHWRDRGAFAPLEGAKAPALPYRFSFGGERKALTGGGPAGPLQGVRVADFSMGWAGPLAARHLGDLGADVLKIESLARRDWWRGWEAVPNADPPPYELPLNFMGVNRSKRGLDLDLVKPEDKAAALDVVRAADVVLENQGPGVMEKLGFGPRAQRQLNPAVVSVTMPPFGATGPLAGLRAYGSTVEQASGMPFVNGREDWDPCMQHVAYGDPVAGLYAAAAALVGLCGRQRLGGGEVEVCQVECLFQLDADAVIAETASGRPTARTGSRRADMAPCCVVRGAGERESWLAVAVDNDPAWLALAQAIGRPDLRDDPGLASLSGRKRREQEIEAALTAWATTLDPRAAAEALQAAGVPAAPVIPTHALFPDPHLQDCGYWAVQYRRYVEDHFTPQPPYRFDGERPLLTRPAPTLGEHTEEVLAELAIVRQRS